MEKQTHCYILQPVGGNARYYKLANKDHRSPDQPAQKATVFLDDVTVGLSEVGRIFRLSLLLPLRKWLSGE